MPPLKKTHFSNTKMCLEMKATQSFNSAPTGDEIKQKLQYFTQVERLSQRLDSTTMSVNSEAFFNVLARIDECLEYMKTHVRYLFSNF